MSKAAAFGTAVVILLLGWANGAVAGLLATLALAVVYFVSLRVHPRMRHTGFRSCNGTGEHRGTLFPWTFRKCPNCNGGRLIRFGAGHFGASHIQSEYARTKQGRKTAKQDGVWR